MDAGKTALGGVVVEGDGVAALVGQPLDFSGGLLHVPERQTATRNEPARIGSTPFVDMPIIISAQMDQRLLLVLGQGEQAAVDAGEAGEIERCGNAVDIHVADTGMDVIAAGPQLLERGRLEAIFLARAANHGVEGHGLDLLTLVFPVIAAVPTNLQLGRAGQRSAGKVLIKDVSGFGDVIIDTDDHHVFHLHDNLLPLGFYAAMRLRYPVEASGPELVHIDPDQ